MSGNDSGQELATADVQSLVSAGARHLYSPENWSRLFDSELGTYWRWHQSRIRRYVGSLLREVPARPILSVGSHGELFGQDANNIVHLNIESHWVDGLANAAVGDAHRLPFPDDTFEAVLLLDSVINYCDMNSVLSECVRVAKDGAVIVLDFDNLSSLEYIRSPQRWQGKALLPGDLPGVPHSMWYYSYEYAREAFTLRGIDVTRVHGSHFLSCLLQDRHRSLAHAAMRLDTFVPPWRRLSAHAGNVVVCGRLRSANRP